MVFGFGPCADRPGVLALVNGSLRVAWCAQSHREAVSLPKALELIASSLAALVCAQEAERGAVRSERFLRPAAGSGFHKIPGSVAQIFDNLVGRKV
jgi:hypothetical protein